MWAANVAQMEESEISLSSFEADYAGESGTMVPLFSSTASISSTALDACHDSASRAVGPFQTFTRSAGSSISRSLLAAIASVTGAFRGGRSTS